MPPHPKYSAQHHCPPGIKETANKRKSGAIDHTWTRIPGNIANGHSSMLPIWVLLAASRPVQVILTSYTRYHKLVRPVDENKETGVVTYTWYLPILKQRCAAALAHTALPLSYPAPIHTPLCCSGGTRPRSCGRTCARTISCSSPSAATALSAR